MMAGRQFFLIPPLHSICSTRIFFIFDEPSMLHGDNFSIDFYGESNSSRMLWIEHQFPTDEIMPDKITKVDSNLNAGSVLINNI